ncbi:MAG: hypothetical protein PHV97_06225 [Candidatus Omnitrophica bacterium]|nr:hypothetical protein [Candidatus Omnitrophota bacterium]
MKIRRFILSRWVVAVGVFCGSFVSLGAGFAPSIPFFQRAPDPRLDPAMGLKTVRGPMEAKSLEQDAVLSRLEEMVLAHRAISISA